MPPRLCSDRIGSTIVKWKSHAGRIATIIIMASRDYTVAIIGILIAVRCTRYFFLS